MERRRCSSTASVPPERSRNPCFGPLLTAPFGVPEKYRPRTTTPHRPNRLSLRRRVANSGGDGKSMNCAINRRMHRTVGTQDDRELREPGRKSRGEDISGAATLDSTHLALARSGNIEMDKPGPDCLVFF